MKNVNFPKNDYICKASDRKTNRVERWMALFVTLGHSLCPTTERILDQILTYMVAVLQNR